jgi:asparagine synthase (glutamine-hydrolysing)
MCGFAGYISMASEDDHVGLISRMLEPIARRGPDASGTWREVTRGGVINFGHRRLSILDLSPAGNQPMVSASGRFVLVYNGEIYNHRDLRAQLASSSESTAWRGTSDTETLLACFEHWGIERSLQASAGMFAGAVWDKAEQSLTLFRDRIGEKPLYYGWQGNHFLFGSELKALRAHPAFLDEVDWDSAGELLAFSYINAPSSIYAGISKLPPGTCITLRQRDWQHRESPMPHAYWRIEDAATRGAARPFAGTYQDAVDELELLIEASVERQSVADVPVGAFLSGGIDSSVVTAMMVRKSPGQVLTFSIGMTEASLDETEYAAAVARHLGAMHTAYRFSGADALEYLPRLSEIWDEPLADSSQLPALLVSRLARQRVTVALSGDGGDELFLGYPKYEFYGSIRRHRWWRNLPWSTFFAVATPLFGNAASFNRCRSLVTAWNAADAYDLDNFWSQRFRNFQYPVRGTRGVSRGRRRSLPELNSLAESVALNDAISYLPDDILAKVDRASMFHSLETRAPLLDHRIIEFAFSLPLSFKLADGVSKRILRDVLYRHVPRHLVDRPKMGFSIPLATWLRTEFRQWGADLIDAIRDDDPFLDKVVVRRLWQEHQVGKNRTEALWCILTLLSFLQRR